MPRSYRSILIQGGNPGTLLVEDGETATLVNSDSINPVIIGDNESTQINDEFTAPLAAGQAGVFTGKTYAIAAPGVTVTILKYAGVSFLGGISSQSPTPVLPNVVNNLATDGDTVDLVGSSFFPDPPGDYRIQLVSGSISSGSNGTPTDSFLVEDKIVDDNGYSYLSCEIGQTAGMEDNVVNGNSLNFGNAPVPAGLKLYLVNGGSGGGSGVLRRCTATLVFYILSNTGMYLN